MDMGVAGWREGDNIYLMIAQNPKRVPNHESPKREINWEWKISHRESSSSFFAKKKIIMGSHLQPWSPPEHHSYYNRRNLFKKYPWDSAYCPFPLVVV